MESFLYHGWTAYGARSYVHACGARIVQRGKQAWIAKKVDGAISDGHESALQAIRWVEAHDSQFWKIGEEWSSGNYFGLGILCGHLDSAETDFVVKWSLPYEPEFPKYLRAPFKRHFLGVAKCARCGGQSSEIVLRPLLAFEGTKGRLITHIICNCGYPVWRIPLKECFNAEDALKRAEYSQQIKKQRRENIREAGGRHSAWEIRQILTFQENRCIYCNVLLADGVQATKDHLIPVSYGGTNWAPNIIMACHRCNSRRGTIPFRTYCKLLSPTQNRRILRCLGWRIAAMRPKELPEGVFDAFCEGIARHDPGHIRYRFILRISPKARQYAATNQLLPRTPDLIVKKAHLL
jgi:5-methylcytosine-specific restriction endonuclease McrA